MKLINDLILIDLKNKNKEQLIVNPLFSLLDTISEEEKDILMRWNSLETIVPSNEKEKSFYDSLIARNYILDKKTENDIKEKLLAYLREENEKIISNPKIIYFVLTYQCNFVCPYCYEKKSEIQKNKYMNKKQVDEIFRINSNVEQIGLFGGEPLLPRNREIIEYIFNIAPNATYFIITNGYYLENYLDFLKKTKVTLLQVTLDGDRETHNKTRLLKNGKPTYDIILKGIKLCLENNIYIKIRMNISESNIENCMRLKEDLKNQFSKYSKHLTFEFQPLFNIEEDKKWQLYSKTFENHDNNINNQNQIFETFPPLSRFFYNGSKFRPIYHFCSTEKQSRFYDANGDIYSCILSVANKHKSIGKYFPRLKYYKNSMLKRNIETIAECKACKYQLICGSGCPNAIIEKDGNCFKPNCFNNYQQCNFMIPFLYNRNLHEE